MITMFNSHHEYVQQIRSGVDLELEFSAPRGRVAARPSMQVRSPVARPVVASSSSKLSSSELEIDEDLKDYLATFADQAESFYRRSA